MFISFEGIDGSGKSTQVQRLAASLRERGWNVVLVREPGGTVLSETVRQFLLDPDATISPLAELFLFTAARAQLVEDVIRPALDDGSIVIADRYADSTLAYQGAGRGLADSTTLNIIQSCATGGLTPAVTVLLDLDIEEAASRQSGRNEGQDRMERAAANFYHRVRSGYLDLARQHADRIRMWDATRPPGQLEDEIREHVLLAIELG